MWFQCSHQFHAVEVAHHCLSQDTTLSERTSSMYFQYDETHYQQIFGMAMGSPVSAMVMEHLEQHAVATTTILPHFWKRHGDNVCIAIKSLQIGSLQSHLNSCQPLIQFTTKIKTVTNGGIAFLDT